MSSIEFRRIQDTAAASAPPLQVLPAQQWIPPASKVQAEASLYRFLQSVSKGRPQASEPLLCAEQTLRVLYAEPHPAVLEILGHCLDLLLLELNPTAARWENMVVSTSIVGVALASYNCLCAPMIAISPRILSAQEKQVEDPTSSFIAALVETLPPARTVAEMLAYHVLLRPLAEALPTLAESRVPLVHALLNRSPLSSLCYLHLTTPTPLPELGRGLLPWWRQRKVNPAPWVSFEDWLQGPLQLLAQPAIAIFLRQRWLSLPETHRACSNLGLLLEGLRRQGHQREFLLEFYEAYDFFAGIKGEEPRPGQTRYWPLLQRIDELVHVGGEGESDIPLHLNRLGNEYFLKFCALINIIIAESGTPKDYQLLTLEFTETIRHIAAYTTLGYGDTPPEPKPIEFVSEDPS